MVSVSLAPGTSGPVAWYWSSEGDRTTHAPATGGSSVGSGVLGARSVENWTEIVEPAATLFPVGEVVTTLSAGGGLLGLAEAGVFRTCTNTTSPAAATASAAAQAARMTHRCGPLSGRACSPELIAGRHSTWTDAANALGAKDPIRS